MISIFVSLFIFFTSLLIESNVLLIIAIVYALISNFIFSLVNIKENLLFLFFHISICTLWLSRIIIDLISNHMTLDDVLYYYDIRSFILIFIVLICIRIGYSSIKIKKCYDLKRSLDFNKMQVIEQISLILFCLTYLPALYTVIDKAIFVQTNSYVEYYTDYTRSYPVLISLISTMNQYCFAAFVGTMPHKKRAKPVIIAYLLLSALLLLSGKRGEFIIDLMLIYWYLSYREQESRNKNIWITNKLKTFTLIFLPFFIVFLGAFNYIRNDQSIGNFNFFNLIIDFFYSQGGGIEHVKNIFSLSNSFPEPHWRYFFAPISNTIMGNRLTSWIFDFQFYQQNTLESALYAFNYGQTYSYLMMPKSYLAGFGSGGNYLAETYLSLGYTGVIIYNLIIGILLKLISKVRNAKWYIFAILFSITRSILYMPRDMALEWFRSSFNLNAVSVYLLISFISICIFKKTKRKNI